MGVGKNIKKYREELGLTQDEVAKRGGFSNRSNISRFEKSADEHITKSSLEKLAKALNVSVHDLLYDSEKSKENVEIGKTMANVVVDEKFTQLMQYYQSLSKEKKDVFMGMFESIKNIIDMS